MRTSFRGIRLSRDNKVRLETINKIIGEYQRQGYILTLRQLYYQLVSRDVIPNRVQEYAKLSKLLTEGRMAGIVDWEAIEDRLRVPFTPASWDTPAQILDTVIRQYKQPRMEGQENYLEVWVEKDALSGVLKRVTSQYHVPIMVNRGYSSVTAIHDSYERFKSALENGQKVEILYLGDFDPSGIDMIRDIEDRPLEMLTAKADEFIGEVYEKWVQDEWAGDHYDAEQDLYQTYGDIEEFPVVFEDAYGEDDDGKQFSALRAFVKSRFKVTPIALTREQITRYNPPPNPAKKTDPRSKDFIKKYGGSSWEVDALKPEVLNALLTTAIESRIDSDKYDAILEEEKIGRAKLAKLKGMLDDIDVDEDDLDNDTQDDDEPE